MIIVIFVLIGFAGMVMHWVKKWSRDELDVSLMKYITSNQKHTIGATASMVVAIVGLFSTADIELTGQSMALAFFAGFSADSAVNKH